MPTQTEVHYDTILSNIAQGYQNNDYIADLVLPRATVSKKSDKYPVWGTETFQTPRLERAPKTRPATVDYALSDDTFYAVDRMLDHGVDDWERDNADAPFDLFRDGTELITEQFLLAKEIRVATLVLGSGVTTSTTLSGNYQWNSGNAASVPLTNIATGITAVYDAIGVEPNTMIMSRAVRDCLKEHSTITAKMIYTNPVFTVEDFLKQYFGFDNVLVGKARYQSTNAGQTATLSAVWSDTVLLAYIAPPPTPSNKRKTLGYQMVWKPLRISRVREETVQTTWVRGSESQDEKITCATAGYRIIDTLA